MKDRIIKPSTFYESLDLFEHMEQVLDLPNWQIHGVYVWKLLRFGVFRQFRMSHGLAQEAHPEVKRLRKSKFQLIKEFPGQFITRNPFLASRRNTDRIVIPHSRKRWIDQRLVDPISWRAWSCERQDRSLVLDRTSPLDPTPLPNTPDYETTARLSWFSRKIFRITLSVKDKERICSIQKWLGTGLMKEGLSFEEWVLKSVRGFLGQRAVYRALFRKTQPKALYIVVGYGLEAPISAAQELGIPTAEFQHGSMDRGHLAYDYAGWENVPYFADHLLIWGESWYRNTSLPQQCRIHLVGAPHIETSIRQAQQDNMRHERKLLILSQFHSESLMEATVQFARLRPDWDVVVRPHPSESASSLRAHLENLDKDIAERITVDKAKTLSEDSSQANVVLGVNSTSLVESLLAGSKVAILRLPNSAPYFQPLIDNGEAWAVESGEDLAACIDDLPQGSARGYFAEPVDDVCSLIET